MHSLIVVDKPKDWSLQIPCVETISAKDYLTNHQYAEMRHARIYNLCHSYRYQGMGYYVSLLAEARSHRSFPNITTIQDFKSQSIVRIISDELHHLIQRSIRQKVAAKNLHIHIYFGQTVTKSHEMLAKQLYNLFPAPLLRVCLTWHHEHKQWLLHHICPLTLNQIPAYHQSYLEKFAQQYFAKKRLRVLGSQVKFHYDLAILVNPQDRSPPSNHKAIEKFLEAAEFEGMRAKTIGKHDYSRILEFDAIFIRETTAVNHHTYRFARRAVTENLVVIDDPTSIVRCANKVYMAEMLKKAHIATPKTIIVHRKNTLELLHKIDFPYVLKQPDGSFSNGVIKVTHIKELENELHRLLNQSDLIIAQEFVPTEFDWRIGVLDKKPIFACKYFMAKNHWQIHYWQDDMVQDGHHEAVALENVPEKVLKLAVRAASLIGNGFYGVDIKQTQQQVMVIEINDNPSIDYNVEDGILKDKLYRIIMQHIFQRIKSQKEARTT